MLILTIFATNLLLSYRTFFRKSASTFIVIDTHESSFRYWMRKTARSSPVLIALALAAVSIPNCAGQSTDPTPQNPPEAPQPTDSLSQTPPASQPQQPENPKPPIHIAVPDAPKPPLTALLSAQSCEIKNAGATMAVTASMRALAVSGLDVVPAHAGETAVQTAVCIPHMPMVNWYARFLNGPEVNPLTPHQKFYLAARNLLDPFNLLTIGGEGAIAVAANSHSAYGPGFPGWGRYTGVSFTQDMTGEFFGTFLIPSLTHQDPHYHRLPNAPMKRRILHAAWQVIWTQGDNGRGMLNYANLAGFAIDDAIGNLYVPGQRTNFSSSASRYAIVLATAPIDNYVSEFLPDIARHVHIQIVIIQRIINQVARTENNAQ